VGSIGTEDLSIFSLILCHSTTHILHVYISIICISYECIFTILLSTLYPETCGDRLWASDSSAGSYWIWI